MVDAPFLSFLLYINALVIILKVSISFRTVLRHHHRLWWITQQELATMIGKHQSFIAKYEGGERRLDLIELIEIGKHINLNLKDLIKNLS